MKKTIFILSAFTLLIPFIAWGVGEISQDVVLGQGQAVSDNFVRAGNVISVHGTVHGDVVVAGSSITIDGIVDGDVIAAGQTITIDGPVAGNIRVVGSTIVINGRVGKNATVFGSAITFGKKSSVGWSQQAFGSTLDQQGSVSGNVNFYGNSATVAADVLGNAAYSLDGNNANLHILENTHIGRDLRYTSPNTAVIDSGASVVGKIHHTIPTQHTSLRSIWQSWALKLRLLCLIALLVVALAFYLVFPKTTRDAGNIIFTKPLTAFGWGSLFFVVPPVAAFILLFTIIGFPLGVITFVLYFLGLYVVRTIAGMFLGFLIVQKLLKQTKVGVVWMLLLGTLLFTLLTWIPYGIGALISLVGTILGLGSYIIVKWEVIKKSER